METVEWHEPWTKHVHMWFHFYLSLSVSRSLPLSHSVSRAFFLSPPLFLASENTHNLTNQMEPNRLESSKCIKCILCQINWTKLYFIAIANLDSTILSNFISSHNFPCGCHRTFTIYIVSYLLLLIFSSVIDVFLLFCSFAECLLSNAFMCLRSQLLCWHFIVMLLLAH